MKMTQFAKFANNATDQILGVTGLQRENLQNMFSSSIEKENIIINPALLQQVVASGEISRYLKIGDYVTIPWMDNTGDLPNLYQYPFVVVDIASVYDPNGVKHDNALWLMARYATPWDIIFDAGENTPVNLIDEPNALEGWYYWGVNGSTYTKLQLNTGDAIPDNYESIVKCGIDNETILKSGYNRWKYSAYRQWINSDANKNEGWWSSQHLGDRPPNEAQNKLPGWLNGFNSEWLSILKPVKVNTACNTVTDEGVIDTTYDIFFLPSVEQMYGVPQIEGVEGKYWQYWKEKTGLDFPYNGSSSNTNFAREIPSISNPNGNTFTCRLRSANRSHSSNVWTLQRAGYINSIYSAYYSFRALPSCVIY